MAGVEWSGMEWSVGLASSLPEGRCSVMAAEGPWHYLKRCSNRINCLLSLSFVVISSVDFGTCPMLYFGLFSMNVVNKGIRVLSHQSFMVHFKVWFLGWKCGSSSELLWSKQGNTGLCNNVYPIPLTSEPWCSSLKCECKQTIQQTKKRKWIQERKWHRVQSILARKNKSNRANNIKVMQSGGFWFLLWC